MATKTKFPEQALVMAAGLGTRMGPLGALYPKVLWPFFESSLLAIQIKIFKKLGIKRFLLNAYHHGEMIEKEMERSPEVKVVHEPTLLGSGGTLHFLKSKLLLEENFFYLVADHFFDLGQEDLADFFDYHQREGNSVSLLGMRVPHLNPPYGALILDKGDQLSGPVQTGKKAVEELLSRNNSKSPFYWTFSGIALIRSETLSDFTGPSSFFDTVASISRPDKRVGVFCSKRLNENNELYLSSWDFGSLEKYQSNYQRFFCEYPNLSTIFNSASIFKKEKIDLFSYGSVGSSARRAGFTVNLSHNQIRVDDSCEGDIVVFPESILTTSICRPGIYALNSNFSF